MLVLVGLFEIKTKQVKKNRKAERMLELEDHILQ